MPTGKRYEYLHSCKNSDAQSIHDMQDAAVEIKHATFRRHCDGLEEWEADHLYFWDKRQGLTLKNDWHVSYYKSVYRGRRCYYVEHSRIEHIWVEKEEGS